MWNIIVCSEIYFIVTSPLSGGILNSVPSSSFVVRKVQCMVELPPCLSTTLDMFGESLNFYTLCADEW